MTNSQPDPVTGQNINIDIGTAAATFTVDTSNLDLGVDPAYQTDPLAYVPPVDPRLNEIHQHLHEINQKVDHILEHLHQPLTGTVTIDCPPKTPAGLEE